jgi:hypothetical protein
MRRVATVALTVAAALGPLLLAFWLDATATPPVIQGASHKSLNEKQQKRPAGPRKTETFRHVRN